jgi:hypothetical protein
MVLLLRAALRVQGHVSSALNGSFIVLFQQDCTDETANGLLVGEDADDVGPALDLCDAVRQGIPAP